MYFMDNSITVLHIFLSRYLTGDTGAKKIRVKKEKNFWWLTLIAAAETHSKTPEFDIRSGTWQAWHEWPHWVWGILL